MPSCMHARRALPYQQTTYCIHVVVLAICNAGSLRDNQEINFMLRAS